MTSTAVVGSTGLVGSHILDTLLTQPTVTTVAAFSRRQLGDSVVDPKDRLRTIIDANSSQWPSDFSTFQPKPAAFFSALGTTRAQAGGFENQRKIDYGLNLELAKAAKTAGVKVYVLISTASASKSSLFGYLKMKAELEEAVTQLDFEKTVFVKPGLIMGHRKDARPPEYVLRIIATFLGKISGGLLKDFWAQDADVIGKAAVQAGMQCLHGQAPEGKVWFLGQRDIIRLGRKEWKAS